MADYLLDILQNALQSGASEVSVHVTEDAESLAVRISDNGKGMDLQTRERALDPFYTDPEKHPGRRVGLGLPFLQQLAESCGGSFALDSEPGAGTTVSVSLPASHPDLPPVGDLPIAFLSAMLTDGTAEQNLTIRRTCGTQNYTTSRAELSAALGDLSDPINTRYAQMYLEQLEDSCGQTHP